MIDIAQTVADNQEYLDICGEHLGNDLVSLKSCKDFGQDFDTLVNDVVNSTKILVTVAQDVVYIAELLVNCSTKPLIKKPACYTKVFDKVISLVDHYMTKTIKILNLLGKDCTTVIADIGNCFHKKVGEEVFNQEFQKCVREFSARN